MCTIWMEFVKVMHLTSAKDIWDKLQKTYEGDDKVKKAKLQAHRRQFESLKMKGEENIANYLLCKDEIVHTIKGLDEKFEESMES